MQPFQYKAIVNRVVDGDTVDVDIDLGFYIWKKDARIRLKFVDTPEKRTKDLLEKEFGLLATATVEELCPVGSEIMLETDLSDNDKFGRILGILLVGPERLNLNQHLLDEHLAVNYTGQSKEEIAEEHINNYRWLVYNGKIVLSEGLTLPSI